MRVSDKLDVESLQGKPMDQSQYLDFWLQQLIMLKASFQIFEFLVLCVSCKISGYVRALFLDLKKELPLQLFHFTRVSLAFSVIKWSCLQKGNINCNHLLSARACIIFNLLNSFLKPNFPYSQCLIYYCPLFPHFQDSFRKNHSEVFSFAQWDCKSLISRLLLIVYIFFFSAISKRCGLKERKMHIFMHTFGIQSLYNHGNPSYWSIALQKFQFKQHIRIMFGVLLLLLCVCLLNSFFYFIYKKKILYLP